MCDTRGRTLGTTVLVSGAGGRSVRVRAQGGRQFGPSVTPRLNPVEVPRLPRTWQWWSNVHSSAGHCSDNDVQPSGARGENRPGEYCACSAVC